MGAVFKFEGNNLIKIDFTYLDGSKSGLFTYYQNLVDKWDFFYLPPPPHSKNRDREKWSALKISHRQLLTFTNPQIQNIPRYLHPPQIWDRQQKQFWPGPWHKSDGDTLPNP